MPYNTSAIPPRKKPTGQTQLPLSRVRKIIALDPDVSVCSSNAAFVITLATELFIQYLAGEAQNMVKLDRKPRRNVQYRDLAQAVSRIDSLEFLEDTIPQTVSYGKIKADAAAAQAKLRSNGRVDVEGGGGAGGLLPAGGSGGGGGGASSTGRGGGGGGVESGGVAAAAALAQAAAAAGATSMALDEAAGPDAQLEQDMRRMRKGGAAEKSGGDGEDVPMLDG